MPHLMITPPMPGAERRFQPFVRFVNAQGWSTEFVRINWNGPYAKATYTVVPGAEHELWHPNYLEAIATALRRVNSPAR